LVLARRFILTLDAAILIESFHRFCYRAKAMVARVLTMLLALLLVGCGKSSPASASTGAADATQIDLVLNQLTQALRKYAVEQRRAPTNFDELVAQGYLAAIPNAPAGKKFAINKNLQACLASQ
jgi:hypothetical protein